MLPIQASEKNVVRAKLLMRGLNMRTFALKHNLPYQSVTTAIDRYIGTPKEPRGRIGYEILQKLQEELDSLETEESSLEAAVGG